MSLELSGKNHNRCSFTKLIRLVYVQLRAINYALHALFLFFFSIPLHLQSTKPMNRQCFPASVLTTLLTFTFHSCLIPPPPTSSRSSSSGQMSIPIYHKDLWLHLFRSWSSSMNCITISSRNHSSLLL